VAGALPHGEHIWRGRGLEVLRGMPGDADASERREGQDAAAGYLMR
jgi:hypothetical protein